MMWRKVLPVNRLPSARNDDRYLEVWKTSGMGCENWLTDALRYCKYLALPRDVGRAPVILLSSMSNL